MKRVLNFILFAGLIVYCILKLGSNPLFYAVIAGAGTALVLMDIFIRKWDITLFAALGIVFVCVDLAVKKVRWSYLSDFIADIRWIYLIPICVAIFLNIGLRAVKWNFLFREKVRFRNLAEATYIGFMANLILPARIGEIIRAFLFAERQRLPKSTVFVTVIVDRIFDGVLLVTFFILLLLVSPFAKGQFLTWGIIGSAVYVAFLAVIILYYFFNKPVAKVILSIVKFFSKSAVKKIEGYLDRSLEGMHLFRNFWSFFGFLFLSFCLWWINLLIFVLLCQSCNIIGLFQIPHGTYFTIGLLLLVLLSLAITIPALPGGAGPYQAAVCAALVFLNPVIANSQLLFSKAAGFSIYIWIAQAVPVILYGLFFMVAGGYTFKSLKPEIKKSLL